MTIKQKIVGKSLGTALLVAVVGLFSTVSMLHTQHNEPVLIRAKDARGLSVLAVHGDAGMREILHDQLCSWKLEAAVVSTGAEALKMLLDAAAKGQPYDVAILDGELADYDTLELGKANAISGDRERCIEAGMDDYVSKPIDRKQMIAAIQTLLAKSPIMARPQPLAQAKVGPAASSSAPVNADGLLPPVSIDALLDRCMGDVETVTAILNEFEGQAVADRADHDRKKMLTFNALTKSPS
jgi:two-component system sensor histidine kinase/response regulator